jgi:hypothetical protein
LRVLKVQQNYRVLQVFPDFEPGKDWGEALKPLTGEGFGKCSGNVAEALIPI